MKKERWFKCYPNRLLGALSGMSTSQQAIYVTVLLRIYESGGSCADSATVLARRCALSNRAVSAALETLIEMGRLKRSSNGSLTNPLASEVIKEANELTLLKRKAGAKGARSGWEKRKRNQRNGSSRTIAEPQHTHSTRDLSFSLSRVSESKAGEGVEEFLPLGDSSETLRFGAAESEQASLAKWKFDEFWRQYPHKVGKRAAVKAFDAAKKRKASFDDLMLGLMRYAAKDDDRPWCNPATFLNQDRWLDEPAPNGGKRRDETVDEQCSRLVEQARELEAARRAERAGRTL